jgi:FkbM family methyltransferase
MSSRLASYVREVRVYRRETGSLRDFLKLMRVRLALSKGVGRLVCRRPILARVRVPSLGGDVWLRSHSSDIGVLAEQLVAGAYDAVRQHPGEVRTILDLGANTGLVARWLLTRFPDARIVCVEPEPGNAEVLRRNLSAVNGRAAVVAKCVGGTERRVSLATSSGEWGFAMTEGPGDVEVTTMDRIIADHDLASIDLLKCDIEGAEREVFEASRSWIDTVRLAVVECHGFPASELLPTWRVLEHEKNPAYDTETVVLVP